MNQEDQKQKYKGRSIPWLSVVRFHKEVVKRAEDKCMNDEHLIALLGIIVQRII